MSQIKTALNRLVVCFVCLILLVCCLFRTCLSTTSSCAGCDTELGATCDVEFITDAIYGCGGVWTNDGVSSGSYLCGEGYSICNNYTYAESLGLTYSKCMDGSIMPSNNHFYATLQSSSGDLTCTATGSDDVFGCADSSGTDGGWLYINTVPPNDVVCGPFGAQLSTENFGNDGWKFGWEAWGNEEITKGSNANELNQMLHRNVKVEESSEVWVYTDEVVGGVMCCLTPPWEQNEDNTDDDEYVYNISQLAATLKYPTLSDCQGCSSDATCDVEFVEDRIFGCAGTWEQDGIQNGEYLCAENYSICDDYQYAERLGLTYDLCMSDDLIPSIYHFYASAQGTPDGSASCHIKSYAVDDVFGCARQNAQDPDSYDTRTWLFSDQDVLDCGAFGAQLSTQTFGNAWVYGWEPWGNNEFENASDTRELLQTLHRHAQVYDATAGWVYTDVAIGGVMCCIDLDVVGINYKPNYKNEDEEELTAFWTARVNELIGSVLILIITLVLLWQLTSTGAISFERLQQAKLAKCFCMCLCLCGARGRNVSVKKSKSKSKKRGHKDLANKDVRDQSNMPWSILFWTFAFLGISLFQQWWNAILGWTFVLDKDVPLSACRWKTEVNTYLTACYQFTLYCIFINRFDKAFAGSTLAYPRYVIWACKLVACGYVIVFIVLTSQHMTIRSWRTWNDGVDCFNEYAEPWVLFTIGAYDAALTLMTTVLFLYKIGQFNRLFERITVMEAERGHARVSGASGTSNVSTNTTMEGKHGTHGKTRQRHKSHQLEKSAKKKIIQIWFMAVKIAILAAVAVASTWFFYYIGFSKGNLEFGRFVPLDRALNAFCILLSFSQNEWLFSTLFMMPCTYLCTCFNCFGKGCPVYCPRCCTFCVEFPDYYREKLSGARKNTASSSNKPPNARETFESTKDKTAPSTSIAITTNRSKNTLSTVEGPERSLTSRMMSTNTALNIINGRHNTSGPITIETDDDDHLQPSTQIGLNVSSASNMSIDTGAASALTAQASLPSGVARVESCSPDASDNETDHGFNLSPTQTVNRISLEMPATQAQRVSEISMNDMGSVASVASAASGKTASETLEADDKGKDAMLGHTAGLSVASLTRSVTEEDQGIDFMGGSASVRQASPETSLSEHDAPAAVGNK